MKHQPFAFITLTIVALVTNTEIIVIHLLGGSTAGGRKIFFLDPEIPGIKKLPPPAAF